MQSQRGTKNVVPVELQLLHGRRCRARRHVAACVTARAVRLRLRQPERCFAEVLVLEQPPHQLRARILLVAQPIRVPGQQHLRFDPYQRRRQLQKLARTVQPQRFHARHRLQELPRDLRDWYVEDVDVLLADQMQQQVEGALETVQLHDECAFGKSARGFRHGFGVLDARWRLAPARRWAAAGTTARAESGTRGNSIDAASYARLPRFATRAAPLQRLTLRHCWRYPSWLEILAVRHSRAGGPRWRIRPAQKSGSVRNGSVTTTIARSARA